MNNLFPSAARYPWIDTPLRARLPPCGCSISMDPDESFRHLTAPDFGSIA
jgi:hypothetical protein